ncbi:MAG: hypothetical protein L0331_12220 [Chloroflexi bacterium]|nr:hypothetical protein [Chloroflexota bacterium]
MHSNDRPSIRIKVNGAFSYVGGLSFVLYGVAQVEQHHFVVAGANGRVARLLWVQFEGFLDDNSRTYNYRMTDRLSLGGFEFLHDADVMNVDEDYRQRPASDSAHVVEYLKEQGFNFSGDTMFKRLVWLDEARRNELMFIYSEDLAPTGFRVADLAGGGVAAGRWLMLSQALHERALGSFTLLPV